MTHWWYFRWWPWRWLLWTWKTNACKHSKLYANYSNYWLHTIKGRLEHFRKLIHFGSPSLPLGWRFNDDDNLSMLWCVGRVWGNFCLFFSMFDAFHPEHDRRLHCQTKFGDMDIYSLVSKCFTLDRNINIVSDKDFVDNSEIWWKVPQLWFIFHWRTIPCGRCWEKPNGLQIYVFFFFTKWRVFLNDGFPKVSW